MDSNAPLASSPVTKHHNPSVRVLGGHGGLEPVVEYPQYTPDYGYHHPGLTPKSNIACEVVK